MMQLPVARAGATFPISKANQSHEDKAHFLSPTEKKREIPRTDRSHYSKWMIFGDDNSLVIFSPIFRDYKVS